MKWMWNIAAAASLSIAIAFGIYYVTLPGGVSVSSHQDMTVFHPERAVILSDANIVDWMIELQLYSRIGKVELDNGVLKIDLRTDAIYDSKDKVLLDLYDLTRFGLVKTTNVKQMMIRVTNTNEDVPGRELLATLHARKEQWGKADEQPNQSSLETFFKSRFSFTSNESWGQGHRS